MSPESQHPHGEKRAAGRLTLRGTQRIAWLLVASAFTLIASLAAHTFKPYLLGHSGVLALTLALVLGVLLNAALLELTYFAIAWMWAGESSERLPTFVISARASRSPFVDPLALVLTILLIGLPAAACSAVARMWGSAPLPVLASPALTTAAMGALSLFRAFLPTRRWGVATLADAELLVMWDDGVDEPYAWRSLPTLSGLIHGRWRDTRGHGSDQLRDFAFVGRDAARAYALANERWCQAKQPREEPPSTASYRSQP